MSSILDIIFGTTGAPDHEHDHDGGGSIVIERPPEIEKPPVLTPADVNAEQPKLPPMYSVMLINDASTSFMFVLRVLQTVFNFTEQKAKAAMLTAHQSGQALIEIYSKEIAEAKVDQAMNMVRTDGVGENGLNRNAPCELTFTAEPETD